MGVFGSALFRYAMSLLTWPNNHTLISNSLKPRTGTTRNLLTQPWHQQYGPNVQHHPFVWFCSQSRLEITHCRLPRHDIPGSIALLVQVMQASGLVYGSDTYFCHMDLTNNSCLVQASFWSCSAPVTCHAGELVHLTSLSDTLSTVSPNIMQHWEEKRTWKKNSWKEYVWPVQSPHYLQQQLRRR